MSVQKYRLKPEKPQRFIVMTEDNVGEVVGFVKGETGRYKDKPAVIFNGGHRDIATPGTVIIETRTGSLRMMSQEDFDTWYEVVE